MPRELSHWLRLWLFSSLILSCQSGAAKFPWGGAPTGHVAEHAQVHTLNDGYARTRSNVWVREIAHPTRATLDYAVPRQLRDSLQ